MKVIKLIPLLLLVALLAAHSHQIYAQKGKTSQLPHGIGLGRENQLTIISKAVQQQTKADGVSVNVRADSLFINVANTAYKNMSPAQRKVQAKHIAQIAANTIESRKLTFPRGEVKKVFVGFFNSVTDNGPLQNEEVRIK